ncbi:MAG: hypothetical protein ACI8UO_005111 [Verrucomicrobiales bacterium]
METLLHQIQQEAINASDDLATLLRKCRVLAQRLENADLKAWVMNELEGYSNEDEVPSYRVKTNCVLIGDYFGPFQSELRNVQIPHSAIDESVWDKIVPVSIVIVFPSFKKCYQSQKMGF